MHEEIIFQQLGSPVFQNKVYPTQDSARRAVLGDVELVQSPASGLVHNRLFDPSLLHYNADYQNEQACSLAFRRHLDEVMGIILPNLRHDEVGVEIGCGKGYFLELLCEAGANITGFDPAYEGSNPRVVKKYFGEEPGEESVTTLPDYIILRHVLEHVVRPWTFLESLRSQCKAKTQIYIEVPCFEWIIEHRAFYDIFYEHTNYFTLNVLKGAFGTVRQAGHFFGGQYLFVVADLSTFRTPEQYNGRQFGHVEIDSYLESLLTRMVGRGSKTFIWGAGAKGVTLANIIGRTAVTVDAIIDINPAKQRKFAAGSGLPIISPSDAIRHIEGADVFVMNPVYLSEIRSLLRDTSVNLITAA